MAGIVLFFAWGIGVSARLPLLGSSLDDLSADSSSPQAPTRPIFQGTGVDSTTVKEAQAISPIKGLIESFRDLIRLFHGDVPTPTQLRRDAGGGVGVDGLFHKVGDETADSATTSEALPPIEDLPGL